MGFKYKPFEERLKTMGDTAEQAFMRWADRQEVRYFRRGIDRPPFNNVPAIPEEIRATPDFLCERTVEERGRTKNKIFYMECKGTSGKTLALKLSAMDKLRRHFVQREYHPTGNRKTPYHVPVEFFVYDSTNRRIAVVSFEQMEAYAKDAPTDRFPDNNAEYYKIDVTDFLWEKEPEDDRDQ